MKDDSQSNKDNKQEDSTFELWYGYLIVMPIVFIGIPYLLYRGDPCLTLFYIVPWVWIFFTSSDDKKSIVTNRQSNT